MKSALAVLALAATASPALANEPSVTAIPAVSVQDPEPIPSDSMTYIRVAMWNLGNKLAMAAVVEANGGDPKRYLQQCERLCKVVGIKLPKLADEKGNPVRDKDKIKAHAKALNYLLRVGGPKISAGIGKKFGSSCRQAFEIGMKSMIGGLMFEAGGTREATSKAIERIGKSSLLPDRLWKPQLKELKSGKSKSGYIRAMLNASKAVDAYLAKGPGGKKGR